MTRAFYTYLLILAVCLAQAALPVEVFSQAAEWGSPFYSDHYTPQEYQGHQSNWAIAQHPDGKVYVGNDVNGVLEYDGVRWRQIDMPSRTTVRSLDVGDEGIVYVGAGGDFGYLAPDSLGQLKFESLLNEIDEQYYGFSDVWGTHVTSEGVYFQTRNKVFRWDGSTFDVWETEEAMHTSYLVNNTFFVREVSHGLLSLKDGELRQVEGNNSLPNRPIFSMERYGTEGEILVATRLGFFLYDGERFTEFETELDDVLEDYSLYHGTRYGEDHYAYSLIGDGVYILNRDGEIVRHMTVEYDLPDNEVNYLFADRENGLWMALHNSGIYRANIEIPLSRFDSDRGGTGVITSIQRHRQRLYVSTSSGLYGLEADSVPKGEFLSQIVSPLNIHTIRSFSNDLLLASDYGLTAWDGGIQSKVMGGRTFSLYVLDDEDMVAAGHDSGLRFVFQDQTGGWGFEQVPGISSEIRSVYQIADGEVWAASGRGEVYRIRYEGREVTDIEIYNRADGVPDAGMTITAVNEVPFIASREGSFRFSYEDQRFVPDASLIADGESSEILSAGRGADGMFYLVFPDRVEVVDPTAPAGERRHSPLALRFPRQDFARTFVEESGIVWISDHENLVRYDPSGELTYLEGIQPMIRGATDVVTGATVYGGTHSDRLFGEDGRLELPYTQNILRVSFAYPEFNLVSPVEYQYRTAGHSDNWSEWSESASVTLPALTEGNYRFEVRARNERGYISDSATMSMRILPPWYRTWWAYVAYILAAVFVTFAYRQYRELAETKRRSQEHAQALARERLVTERLKQANESLDQANRLKETFLANTSHELRTPLTAILGFASVLKEEADGRHQEFLGIIEENGERLLRTLNALLDLAKIRAGIEEPELERVDVPLIIKGVLRMMVPLAENKNLDLHYDGPDSQVYALLDEPHFRRIMQNLVGNAIKFTAEGHVAVDVSVEDGSIVIKVIDTGIGISKEFLPELFDEFQQESSGTSRDFEGTGLGLAISSRLVQVMNGTITVESVKGEGSVFTVTFDQVVDDKYSSNGEEAVREEQIMESV